MTKNSDELIFTEVKERLKDQFDSIDSLDTKSGIALGFVGALLAALLNSDWFVRLPFYYLLPILILLCLVAIFALRAFLVRGYRKDPEPSTLIKRYQNKNETETLGVLIKNFEASFNDNVRPIEDKKKYLNWSFILLASALFVIAAVVLLSSFCTRPNKYFNWEREVIKHGRFR